MANFETVITATTSAVASQQPSALAMGDFQCVSFGANNLAGAETAPLYVKVDSTWKAVTDFAGTPVVLTASIPAVEVSGGAEYGFTKSATAGACGVYVIGLVRR